MGVLYTDDGSTFDFKAKSAYCLVRYSAFGGNNNNNNNNIKIIKIYNYNIIIMK
jgi:hypothetical protein